MARPSLTCTMAVFVLVLARQGPVGTCAAEGHLKVKSVRPARIVYEPGEQAAAEMVIANAGEDPAQVEVRLWVVTELDDRRRVASQRVEIPAGQNRSLSVPFRTSRTEYGREIVAELVQHGRVLHANSDVFGVADNLWKVSIGGMSGGPIHNSADYSDSQIIEQMALLRDHYCNWFEKHFWAPDDWGELTPEPGATWTSGQARRHENTEKLKLQIDSAHRHGIRAITYGKCMAGGVHGWEMARRRPQWFVVDVFGRTMGRPADVWDMDHWEERDRYAYGDYRYVWTYRWVDLRRIDALDYGIDELIASTRQFGWDGVRFDSGGFRAHWVDGRYNGNDAVNTRNMKRLKERLWQAYPGYLFGYNTDNPASQDGRNYPCHPTDAIAHEVREMLAGGGLWMGEGIREWRNGNVRYTRWSEFARDEVRCIRTIKHHGGHFCYSYGLWREGKAARLYKFVIGTMMGAHQYVGAHVVAPGSENWGRFLTRWSAFLWDHRLRPLEETEKSVAVTSRRRLWWQEFANERVVSSTRRYVIVHLLNPPLHDEIARAGDELPEPVDDAEVTFSIPRGQRLTRVFFISPGYPDRACQLEAAMEGSSAKARVPRFDVWAMVVWALEGDFVVPKEAPRFTEPLSAEEQAELKRTRPRPMEKTPRFRNVPPAPTLNIAVADDLRDPAPQHTGAEPGAPDFGQPEVQMPDGLVPGGEPGLDVLVVKGFYHHVYGVPDALEAAAPDARTTECTTRDMPNDHAGIFEYDIIVLVDMGADSWDADGHKCLADFVAAGGRLVILGGPFALGQGFYKGTALEKVLPVEVRPARDVYQLPAPLPLGPRKGIPYPGAPLLYFYHAVSPRADAEPLMWAGELPVLWQRKVGDGTSLVFVGTILGEASGQGETPFWEWRDWPETLGRAIVRG